MDKQYGYIIYKKNDVSLDYVNWQIHEFKKQNIILKLLYEEDFLLNGVNDKIDFVINKTRNVNISYIFELNNIKVFNNSFVSELSSNKLKAYKYAQKHGLTTANILINKPSYDFIKKTVDGHGGNDVYLTNKEFISTANYFCQSFIKDTVGDIRYFIVGNKIVNSCIRKNENSYLHNYKQGAKVEIYNYSHDEEILVNKFLENIYCDYVGIDFLLLKNGDVIFNEIEDVCGSRMLSHLGVNNTTSHFIEHIIQVLGERK